MANAFTLFGEIKLDTSQLNSGLSQAETRIGKTKTALDGLEGSANRAGSGVTSFGSSASSSGNAVGTFTGKLQAASGKLDSIGGAFLAAGASLTAAFTVPLTGLAYAAVNTSKDLQSLEMGLTAVTGSADEAKKQMAQLKEVAKLPGLGMKEALQGAINLQATGLSAETSQRALKAFGNALATVGKGKADLQGVITALSQIQSKGKVSAEEINQIAERVPQIRKVMQGAFGTTEGKELEKRKVGTEQFIKGVITELEKLPPVATSAQGEFENFADAVDAALKPLGDAILPILVGAMQKLQPVIQSISETFAGLSPEMQTIILAVGAIVAAIGPLLVIIGTLALSISSIITLGQVLIPVFAAVGGTLTASFLPVIATIAAVVAAGYLLYQAYQTNFAGIKDLVDAAMSAVVDTFNAAKQVILDFWAKNGSAIMKAYNTIKDAVGKIIKAVEPFAKVLIDIFANQVVVVWNIVKSVFGYIYDVISSFVMFFVDIVNGDWKSAGADLVNFFLAPINLLLSVLANLYDLVTYPFRKLLDWLKGFLPEWAQKAIGIGESMIDGVSDTMKKGIPKIDAAAYRAGEAVPNGITQGVQGGADAANQATANFINGVGDIVEENGKKVVAIADATGKSLQGSLDKLAANTELSPELRKKLKAEADKIGDDLAKSLSDADKKALAGSQRLINTLNELLKNPNLSQGLKDAITTELNRLNTAMNDAGKRLGTDVVAGFVQGVRDRKENIFTAGNDLGQTAIKGAKTGLKSQSPSKVFEAIGFDVVQGFVNGINNNKQLAQVAANALLDVEKFAKKGKNKGERAALEALAELINENKRLETVGIANLTILEMTDAKFKGVTAATIKRIIAEKELKAAIENRLSTEERVKGILEEVIKSAYPQELSNLDKVKQALSDLAKANGIVEQSIKQRAIRAAIALDLEKQLAAIAEKGLTLKPSVNAGQIGGGLIGEEDPTLPPPLYKDAWDEFSRTVRDRIRRAYSDLPSFGEFFQTSILDSLSRVGDIFVDAVNNWDGTLGGFFKNVAIGFGKMIQQILADLARLAIQRLVLQLLSSIGASIGGGTITSAQAAAQGVDLSFPDFSGIGLSPTMGGAIGNAPTMGMMPSLAGVTNNSSSSVTNNNVNVNVSGAVGNNQQTGQMIQKQVIAALRKTERRTR